MKYLLVITLLVFFASTASALPDAEWTYDYYDENGNHVGRRDIWCGGVSSSGTVTDNYIVLYWGPCQTMEPWLGCDSAGLDWTDMPGDCGMCMSPGYAMSYNFCMVPDCDGLKPGCIVSGPVRREKPPARASSRFSTPVQTASRLPLKERECMR